MQRSDGKLVVADYGNHKIRIVGLDGSVATMGGSTAGFADGGMAGAKFNHPQGIAIADNGDLFVTDLDNFRIRRISADGLPARAIVARNGDARAQLHRLIEEQAIDLAVLSSHGTSSLAGTPCGSVTEYLAARPPAPLLILRPDFAVDFSAGDEEHAVTAQASAE